MDETAASFLVGKHPHKPPPCSTLVVYDKMPIFIPVDIMEDVVELVVRKIFGSSVPGGTDSEALQGCLLKVWEDRKKLSLSVEIFVYWIANKSPPWSAYYSFMSGRMILLDKHYVVCPVGAR